MENTTQIMWPSLFAPGIYEGPLHQRSKAVSRILMEAEPSAREHGNDIIFDFDIVIDKAPRTDTPVPWHQDEVYWHKANLAFSDLRAARCWDDDDDVFYLFLQKQKPAQSYIPQGYFPPYEAVYLTRYCDG